MNSNITCSKFKKLLLFFCEVYFKGGTPKIYTMQLKDICNGVHFFHKIAGWESATLPKRFLNKNYP